MAKRKHGDAKTWAKVREAQSRLHVLQKAGVIKNYDKKTTTIKVTRSGEANVSSRAMRKALADFNPVFTGGAKITSLTHAERKKLAAAYDSLPPESRPVMRNGRVLVGEGMTVTKRDGTVRIEAAGTKSAKNDIRFGPGWKERVRKDMARRKSDAGIGVEFTENATGQDINYFEGKDADGFISYISSRYSDAVGNANVTIRIMSKRSKTQRINRGAPARAAVKEAQRVRKNARERARRAKKKQGK